MTLCDDGSDHVCLIGDIVDSSATEAFTALRLEQVDHIAPGHGADERGTPARFTASTRADRSSPSTEATRLELESIAAGSGHPLHLTDADTTQILDSEADGADRADE